MERTGRPEGDTKADENASQWHVDQCVFEPQCAPSQYRQFKCQSKSC